MMGIVVGGCLVVGGSNMPTCSSPSSKNNNIAANILVGTGFGIAGAVLASQPGLDTLSRAAIVTGAISAGAGTMAYIQPKNTTTTTTSCVNSGLAGAGLIIGMLVLALIGMMPRSRCTVGLAVAGSMTVAASQIASPTTLTPAIMMLGWVMFALGQTVSPGCDATSVLDHFHKIGSL